MEGCRCAGARRTALGVLVAGLALLVVLMAAAPASAIIVKLRGGKILSYEALVGKSPIATAGRARPHDAAFSNLDYSGGPVMPSNVNYVIDWQPSNYAGTGFQGVGSQNVINGVAQFFKDLQSASGSTTNSD